MHWVVCRKAVRAKARDWTSVDLAIRSPAQPFSYDALYATYRY